MAETVHVKPAAGLLIRNPGREYTHLPAEGEMIVLDDYWRRRLRDGDVELVVAPPAAPATSRKKQ